eukprot:jgi/Undpi1/1331/HiC_scaffold_11.g04723.m1
MAGGVGFGGSMLGEVLASCSMSTLPPSKRHSISATSAHFEELAAEAGIDPEAEEINIEDLRMYRMEEDCGYTQDDDSDADDDDGNNNAGSSSDKHHHLHDDANAGSQKLAHKERSILQMVDVLSDRLTSLNAVVINRYNGCKSDLDEATEFRSSRTKKMAIAAEGDWSSSTPRRGVDKAKRGALFSQGGEGGEGGDAVGPSRMTFRNAPQTDAGRKLAHQFEQEYGAKQTSSATPKFSKTSSTKLKRVDHYKKSESRKHERIHFERKLQSNLDQYVTRAVTELLYRTPEDTEEGSGPENPGNSQDDTSPAADAGVGDGAHASGASEVIARERFPIPMEPNEMNPKLLLSYACERTVLPGGTRMFKHFATSTESQHLFVYMFWFIHCKFFQEESRREQAHLLRAVAGRYVGVLGTEGMDEYKDFFFKHYPFLVANAVFWGFHYLCPGSRHLYSNAFKRVLYLQCARILSGIEITPSSTTEMRTKLFPDETAEAMDDLEYHPHHVHTTGARSAGPGVGSGSGASPPAGVPPPSEIAKGAGERSLATPGTGPTKTNTRKGAAESGASGADGGGTVAGGGERGSGKSGGDGGTMMQRMNKTFRPDPLGAYTGDRSTLRFKPRRQEGSTMLRPRQQRTVFDASQISPMLQEHLRQSSSTAGRRPENIVRTVPVPWCQSGGSDTYRRHPSRKDVYDAIKSEHTKAKKEYARSKAQAAETLRRTLRHADADRHAIFKKGPRQVGLKSMDIVTELQQHGAFKGFKRHQ